MNLEQEIRLLLSNVASSEAAAMSVESEINLFEAGVIDSLSLAVFISLLEEKCGVEIDAEDIVPGNFSTIQHIIDFIRRKGNG